MLLKKHVSCQFPVVSSYLKQYDNIKDNEYNTSSFLSGIFSQFFTKLDTIPT